MVGAAAASLKTLSQLLLSQDKSVSGGGPIQQRVNGGCFMTGGLTDYEQQIIDRIHQSN